MIYHSAAAQAEELSPDEQCRALALLEAYCQQVVPSGKRRGRPARVSWPHFCLALVHCFLRGWHRQLDLWRVLTWQGLGPFEACALSDQAVYNRLARADGPMRSLFEQVSLWLRDQLSYSPGEPLAPFASQVLALDESTLEGMSRWLPHLRRLAVGDPALLAGRLCGLFDVRLQQWVRVDLLAQACVNCKVHAPAMLAGLAAGTLLLFDRGYLSFAFFDELTEQGLWWVSRYANKVSYQVLHVCYQGDGVLDAVVYLGTRRADQARHPVRLLRFWFKGRHYQYLSNVLDPQRLSLADIARLYARRWDIELAFRLLKDHLGLNEPWSAKWAVIGVQIWTGLLLGQLLHAMQSQIAQQAGVDPFEVSIALLSRLTPTLLERGLQPLAEVLRRGRDVGLIRKSTRVLVEVPSIDPAWLSPVPPAALRPRERVRHAQRNCGPRSKPRVCSS